MEITKEELDYADWSIDPSCEDDRFLCVCVCVKTFKCVGPPCEKFLIMSEEENEERKKVRASE